jgi:hypothetical protein
MVDAGRKLSASPLQIVWASVTGLFVITGTGLTVTVTSSGAPAQPLADGVTR